MKHKTLLNLFIIIFFLFGSTLQSQDNSKILWTANWSHNGHFIAIGGNDKKVRIYHGKTFELLKTYENESEIKRLRWHPNQNILAVAAEGNGSKLIDLDADKIIKFKSLKTHGSRAIEWGYDGSLIALADFDGKLFILNKKGEPLKTILKEGTYSYVGVDWHPKKNEIITLSEKIRTYNVKGELLNEFKHREEDILLLCVKWHKSGKFFVIGDYGNPDVPYKPLLQFWREDGRLIKEKKLSKAEYRNISFNKKGKRLATASDTLRIWSKNGKLLFTGLSEDYLWGIDWSPDGNHIVTSSENGKIIIWDKKARIVKKLN